MNRLLPNVLLITCTLSLLASGRSHAQSNVSVAGMPRQSALPQSDQAATAPVAQTASPVAEVPQTVAADPSRELGVGDQVTFSIVEDSDPPVALRVTDTGELDIPYIGRVSVTGKTCAQVAAQIKSRLEAKYYYTATVRLGINQVNVAASMGQIYLSGLVRVPGPQPFYSGQKLTVSAAILKAGGFTQFADSRKVKVTRKSADGRSVNYTVDVKAILDDGKLDQDMPLQDGDYVNVPQRMFNW